MRGTIPCVPRFIFERIQMKKKTASLIALAGILLSFWLLPQGERELTVNFPSKFEGKSVELISLLDSVRVDSAKVSGGVARFNVPSAGSPVFMQVTVDGRGGLTMWQRPGHAVADTLATLRERRSTTGCRNCLSSWIRWRISTIRKHIPNLSERKYNENKDNVMGTIRSGNGQMGAPERVDSMLAAAPPVFRTTRRVKYYEAFARHRAATAPGRRFIDFKGETATGAMQRVSHRS